MLDIRRILRRGVCLLAAAGLFFQGITAYASDDSAPDDDKNMSAVRGVHEVTEPAVTPIGKSDREGKKEFKPLPGREILISSVTIVMTDGGRGLLLPVMNENIRAARKLGERSVKLSGKPEKLEKKLTEGHSFAADKMPSDVYSAEKVKKALDEIDAICRQYAGKISFAYKDIGTGAFIHYRADTYYGTCSTIKAPYCRWLLGNKADLKEKLTVNAIWRGDSGKVARAGIGKKYTARELIEYTISLSDNTAYLTLVNRYGFEGFNEMNSKLGVSYRLGSGYIFTECTARDLMKQYEDIYDYSQKSRRGKMLTGLMQDTDVETQITAQLAKKYPVAHKYGTDFEQTCYHDCAICYADSPFVLVIMTRQVPENAESDKVFHKLAKQFDIISDQFVL